MGLFSVIYIVERREFVNDNILQDIELFIKTHLFLEKVPEFKDWYEKELYYMNIENNLLKELSEFLKDKYSDFYDLDNLKHITKLFLLYPDGLPSLLNDLTWDITKILLDIFDEDKREFYINLCYEKNLSVSTLKKYLNNEIYEKFLYCLATYYEKEEMNSNDYSDLIDKVITICERII